ncbi:MAG: OsmC family protein [Verrucomicrobiae bacterium]|nr:OsmC family protein [Verrucomicrobiae bacterium]
MDAVTLRGLQAPLKEQYKADPGSAVITLRAKGVVDEMSIACKLETGRAMAVAGLHPATGGTGIELCSGDMLLEALVACAGVTLKAVSTAIGVKLDHAAVNAEGDLDFRGTLGVDKTAAVGFSAIRLTFDVKSPAPPEQIAQLLALTERYCVVYQTLRGSAAITAEITNSATASASAPG